MRTILFGLSLLLEVAAAAPVAFAHNHGGAGFTHLTFANGAIHAHCSWIKGPQSPQESVLQIQWMDGSTHTPAEPPGDFQVWLFMPDMGHRSAPTQKMRHLDSNGQPVVAAYDVTNVYFTMGGKWQVNVTLTYANGAKETQTIDLEIAEAANGGGGHHHH